MSFSGQIDYDKEKNSRKGNRLYTSREENGRAAFPWKTEMNGCKPSFHYRNNRRSAYASENKSKNHLSI